MEALPVAYTNASLDSLDRPHSAFQAHRSVFNLAQLKWSFAIEDVRALRPTFLVGLPGAFRRPCENSPRCSGRARTASSSSGRGSARSASGHPSQPLLDRFLFGGITASLGGETTFFRPLGDRDVAKSRRGFTIAVGDGAAPLTRVSARVRGRTGAALFFPHGTVSRCFESPLHEGSAVRGNAAKYVLRTDVCYFA